MTLLDCIADDQSPPPLSQSAINLVDSVCVGHIGTVTEDGHPHVSPVNTVWVLSSGYHFAFAHIQSHRTVRHLRTQPHIALSVTEPRNAQELLVRGLATIATPNQRLFDALAWAYQKRRGSLPLGVHAFVVAEVLSWRLIPDANK